MVIGKDTKTEFTDNENRYRNWNNLSQTKMN